MTRLVFHAYQFPQLQTIIQSRLEDLDCFDPDAIQMVARCVIFFTNTLVLLLGEKRPILLFHLFCDNFESHLSFHLFSSLMGRVESMQIAVLYIYQALSSQ
jgi:hypothetical protein